MSKLHRIIAQCPAPPPPPPPPTKIKALLIPAENSWKAEMKLFPHCVISPGNQSQPQICREPLQLRRPYSPIRRQMPRQPRSQEGALPAHRDILDQLDLLICCVCLNETKPLFLHDKLC